MSIYAYVGMPGSGKSYDVVANQIMPALRAGRMVVTNVAVRQAAIRAICPNADLREFPTELIAADPPRLDEFVAAGCVLVLDEVWRIWPAGQKAHHVPEPFKRLLAEHRHMVDAAGNSTQIVLVTQDLAQIGAFARQLVEQTFYHTKLTSVGASGSYRIDIYHGPRTGPSPAKEARINSQLGRYSKEVFTLYDSHTMRQEAGSGANEVTMDRRGNVWRRPALIAGAVACVLLAAWAVPTVGAMIKGDGEAEGRVGAAGGERPRAVVVSGIGRVRPASSVVPGRISAIVEAGPDSYAVVEIGSRAWRVPLHRSCSRTEFSWECQVDGMLYWFEGTPYGAGGPGVGKVAE